MDLKQAWKTLEKEKLTVPVSGSLLVPKHSKHPVNKLIHAFGAGLIFCIVFEALFVSILFTVDQHIVQLGIGAIIILYAYLFYINLRVFRTIRQSYRSDENVLSTLSHVHRIVSETIRFQQKISWGFFPICVAAGFLLGVSLKKDAATAIVQPVFYLTLIVTMAIVTPACYFLTKWMTKIAYGKYLKQIEELIRQAEQG
jgi:hypothetical protein